jgi:cytochrome c-type biogenesis protein CcmH/NrfG
MNYWKGLLIAVAVDAALIAGCQFLATEPPPPSRSQAIQWPSPFLPLADADSLSVGRLTELDRQVDSLMVRLQERPQDVNAMLALARLYAEHGWHEKAIGPLARALQIDPHRRSLWVALDHAVEKNGQTKITDAELVRAAQEFVEAVDMWGHGC